MHTRQADKYNSTTHGSRTQPHTDQDHPWIKNFFSNRAFPLSITFITEIHCLRKLKLEGLGKEEKRVRGNSRKPTICACHQEQQIMGRKPAITQNCLQKLEKYRTYYSRTSPGQGQKSTTRFAKMNYNILCQ